MEEARFWRENSDGFDRPVADTKRSWQWRSGAGDPFVRAVQFSSFLEMCVMVLSYLPTARDKAEMKLDCRLPSADVSEVSE